MENKLYTKTQIKDAIWQELKESGYTGDYNDRAYEIIGVVMAGIDKIPANAPTGPRWVKGARNFPVKKPVIAKKLISYLNKEVVGTASSATGEMICFDWGVSSVCLAIDHEELNDLCWLDESTPAGRGEDIAEQDRKDGKELSAHYAHIEACEKKEAVAFAEWGNSNVRGYDPVAERWVYGKDEGRYTTAELYDIFKKEGK